MNDRTRVVVTGANGFVGSHLCERLLSAGRFEVRALVRKSANLDNLKSIGVEIIPADINDPASLTEPFSGAKIIFHVAGAVRESKNNGFMRANRDGARQVAQVAATLSGPPPTLVLISSQAAAGPAATKSAPRTELETPAPVSDYGRSKLAGEEAVRAFMDRLPITIVRPCVVYGPRDDDFYDVFRMARWGVVLKPSFRSKVYSFVHAHDLADAIILAAEKGRRLDAGDPAAGVYFVSDGGIWTYEQIAELCGQALGKKPRVVPIPEAATFIAAAFSILAGKLRNKPAILDFNKATEIMPDNWICSIGALQRDTGFSPAFSLPEGLKATAEWYRHAGWLPPLSSG